LAREGVTIVRGMARGIDTAAHEGALETGGRTMAILGSGVDVIYPPENKKLVEEIIKKGAVISEYPLGTRPDAPHFPQRNRIISGLAKGVLVVEAPLKSGALITANFALEQGRDVFAVPGNITNPNAQGVNRLIKEGAKLVECVEDILEELDFSLLNKEKKKTLDEEIPSLFSEERKVLELLEEEPLHIDSLVSRSGLPASKVGGLLMKLQLKGLARELPGKLFVRDR
ncbi:DNA-protecting protein DprA, partial [Candidatus Aerophobetes bacterium]